MQPKLTTVITINFAKQTKHAPTKVSGTQCLENLYPNAKQTKNFDRSRIKRWYRLITRPTKTTQFSCCKIARTRPISTTINWNIHKSEHHRASAYQFN